LIHQNNFVDLKNNDNIANNIAKNFDIIATSLSVPHNYFDSVYFDSVYTELFLLFISPRPFDDVLTKH